MRKVAFLSQAFADFHYWAHNDRKVLNRVIELIRDIDRSPFTGIGKPEPLKSINCTVLGRAALQMSIGLYTPLPMTRS